MKIVFINLYSGWVNRGAETFIHEVAQRLSIKNEVVLYQFGPARGREKYKVVNFPININWKKDLSGTLTRRLFLDYWSLMVAVFTIKLLPKIWKDKPEIVIPVNGGWQPALVRIITWLYGGKMVISGQSGPGWDDRNNLWCFPDAFVSLSKYSEAWAKKANPLLKVLTIPNGVDTGKFTSEGEKIKTKLEKPVVVCAGAFTPSKRIDLAVKAVAKLKKVSLLLVGDGELKSEIENLGKKLLGNRFELVKLPFEKMPQVYRLADVFTLPSESYYSFEIVLVEAMSTNVPVVANDDAIRREIVGDAGFFVDPTDINAYSATIKKALEAKWDNKPHNQAKKFDWNEITAKYEKLFIKLLK